MHVIHVYRQVDVKLLYSCSQKRHSGDDFQSFSLDFLLSDHPLPCQSMVTSPQPLNSYLKTQWESQLFDKCDKFDAWTVTLQLGLANCSWKGINIKGLYFSVLHFIMLYGRLQMECTVHSKISTKNQLCSQLDLTTLL